jgi:hypothetical protein
MVLRLEDPGFGIGNRKLTVGPRSGNELKAGDLFLEQASGSLGLSGHFLFYASFQFQRFLPDPLTLSRSLSASAVTFAFQFLLAAV